MKRIALLVLYGSSLIVLGCAVKAAPVTPFVTPIPGAVALSATTPNRPLALLGLYGAAHACPVLIKGEGHVITAGHVAWHVVTNGGELARIPKYYLIEDGVGNTGAAGAEAYNMYTDLAYLTTDLQITRWYSRGNLPAVGDEVTWVEYDFTKPDRAYRSRERSAKVLNVRLSHIMFDKVPASGASGTCLFNVEGEVVGIVSWRQVVGAGEIGVAVGLSVLE